MNASAEEVYLNSSLLQQLNATVQAYLAELVSTSQTFNSSQIVGENVRCTSGSIVVGLVTLYLVYYLLFSKNKVPSAVQFKVEIPDAAQKHWKGKRIFPCSVFNPEQPGMIQSYCPATGQFLGSFKSMTESDIDNVINAASAAQVEWAKTSYKERLQVLLSLKYYILENQEAIARVACRDSGKTMLDASMGEILVTLEKIEWIMKHGEKALKPSKRPGPTNFFMKWYKGAEVRYEPLGVVGAIVSWNYPFHNLLGPIVASIFTGNAIVVKCSEQVVWSSNVFTLMVQEALKVCGHDPNLVQLCYSLPPSENDNAANYFTSHPGFKHLTFIGSKPVAHHVLRAASVSLTPVVVELGGKDAFIVLDSVKDLQSLSSIIMRGTFQSAGQNCIGIERVIVSAKNYDKLVAILNEKVGQLRLGSDIDNLEDVDMGAMISDNRFEQLENLVSDAVSKGARLLHGGSRYNHPNYPQGHFFQPTLLVDVTEDMEIAQNEVFGPVLTVMKANNTDDCIRLANSAPFGLGGSIFGADYEECDRVANSLVTGNVAINDFATFYVCQLPFGGLNGSGYGKFGGEEGLLGLCNAKSVCYDKLPFVSTQIPKPLDYPIRNNTKAWNFVKSFITGAYAISTWQRIKSLISLAKNAN
ncbi:Meiotic Sister-Chromatid recombination aldehyde dehydrogenase [Kluyveromyces marxianus]|nr:Meiotic Sister-Chromatid recombination aldehyde dehydrogenase [Kluyveromyces marxianus]